MPEAWPGILVRIRKRDFIADRVLLQEPERVAYAHVVVRLGNQSGPVKIRAEHDEHIGAGSGVFLRRLILSPAERGASQYKNSSNCSDDHPMASHRGSLESGEARCRSLF